MQVWLLVETWGVDAPQVLGAYERGADAYKDRDRYKIPGNYAVWGPYELQ